MENLTSCIDKLTALRDAGVVDAHEFATKRQALVDQFVGLQSVGSTPGPARAPMAYRPPAPPYLAPPRSAYSLSIPPRLVPMGKGGGKGPRGFFAAPQPRFSPYAQVTSTARKQLMAEWGTTIKVQPIPEGVDDSQLAEAFAEYGAVLSASVHTGAPPYGHVNFATREAANTVASLDRFDWGGQICFVTLSRKRWEVVVEGPPTNGIGIFGLPLTSTQQGLEQLLSPFPGIIAIKMVHNRAAVNGRGGEFKGYAFVYFDTVDNASRARSQISGMVIDGCTIDAKYSNRSLE